ncbi:MAG: arginine--tRNA ligase, partial [bacterium]|nr:arginine--tRNA ligase [bacterium]
MKTAIENLIKLGLQELGVGEVKFVVEHPTNLSFGDYSTNAGIISGRNEELKEYLEKNQPAGVEKIELAGPGFINFYLSKDFFKNSIGEIISEGGNFGKNKNLKGEKVIVEHTDPNPFKEFHIGHLMPNVIGSTLARVFEWSGAEVKQVCYQGDVGLHIAKAVWGMQKGSSLLEAYAIGHRAFEEDGTAKQVIQELNKKIYERSDEEINKVYDQGKKDSLEYFDEIYKKLGAKFDYFFFESETGENGKGIVEDNIGKVFEESDGAVVFRAEKLNPQLHTRVFLNSEGLPTYEAKELGLAPLKFEKYPYDISVVVTGSEINDYFRVVLEAMKQIFPDLAAKTKHLSHGMLRLPTGKMSSRTGDVITAEELIEEVKEKVKGDEQVAIGAIKYMILRQAIGNDIIFDIEKSVSTEGDSGVYLQYTHARSCSILGKAKIQGGTLYDIQGPTLERETHEIEKLLYRFPEIVELSLDEYAPHRITTYLTELAGSFNNFYAHEQVIPPPGRRAGGDSP